MTDPQILKRNQLALSSFDPRLAARTSRTQADNNLVYIRSRTELPVPARKIGGSVVPFHSKYDPVREGEKMLHIHQGSGFLVFLGFGAGYHLLPFLQCKEVSNILIIDKDLSLFRSVMENVDLRAIIIDHRVRFLIDKSPEEIKAYLLGSYIPAIDGNLKTIPLLAWLNLEKTYFQQIMTGILDIISQVADDYTVQVQFGRRWFTNTIMNLAVAERSTHLLKPMKKVLVTGAGPSLEEQIPQLKKLRPEGFLIATDTSLPALLTFDIIPDSVISIDCQQISYHHFIRGLPPGVPLILDLASPPILTRLTDKVIFFSSGHPFSRYVTNYWRMFPPIDTSGGNVSHAAVSLAGTLGAQQIYLFGLDFSFPEGKTYVRDTYQYHYFRTRESRLQPVESCFFNSIFNNKRVIKERPGGFIRYTTKPMINYKERLENAIKQLQAEVIQIPGKGIPLIPAHSPGQPSASSVSKIFAQGPPAMSWQAFLTSYLKQVAELPEPYFPIIRYLNDLSNHQRDLWTTQYPAAAAIRKYEFDEAGLESSRLLKRTREWTITRVTERLRSSRQAVKAD